jgi:Protein of unknown function (DUF3007)
MKTTTTLFTESTTVLKKATKTPTRSILNAKAFALHPQQQGKTPYKGRYKPSSYLIYRPKLLLFIANSWLLTFILFTCTANSLSIPSSLCGSSSIISRFHTQGWPHASTRLQAKNGTGEEEEPQVQKSTEFGYSRKDIILIGAGLIGFGYVLYYGLQASGMDAGMAGNWVQLIIFLGICVVWVGSYLWRVATKQMTYARQLEDYEEAVMRKRLEEMPDAELESIMADIERAKETRRTRKSS